MPGAMTTTLIQKKLILNLVWIQMLLRQHQRLTKVHLKESNSLSPLKHMLMLLISRQIRLKINHRPRKNKNVSI